ncbi:hypothetical protein QC760_010387 [Botrytis cinerea]
MLTPARELPLTDPHVLTRSCIDPNAPKRGLSAYMFFANEQRDNVREENPGISFGQVGKVLGERWKALNEKQRGPYEESAARTETLRRERPITT